jgi:hypothetical protein
MTGIDRKLDKMTTALTNLQNADLDLQAEVAAFLADVAAALRSAGNDTAVQAVATDIENAVANLRAGDPLTPPASSSTVTPVSTSTGTSTSTTASTITGTSTSTVTAARADLERKRPRGLS